MAVTVQNNLALTSADVASITAAACGKPMSVDIESLQSGTYRKIDTELVVKYADVICKPHATSFSRPGRRMASCNAPNGTWQCKFEDYIDVTIGTDVAYLRAKDAPLGLEIFAYLNKYRWFLGDDISALVRRTTCKLSATGANEWTLRCGENIIWLGRFCPTEKCRFEVFGISPVDTH